MIDASILPVFLIAVFFLAVSPGPDLLLLSSYSSARGVMSGLMIALGIFLAGIIQTTLVTFGLGQVMQALPPLVMGIKFVGALYLIWLGVNMLRAWRYGQSSQAQAVKTTGSHRQLVLQGLLNNLMNPKALLFFSLFLPQFTVAQLPMVGQVFTLGVILSTLTLVINIVFVISFSQLSTVLSKKVRLGRHVDGLLALVFFGLAARLATSK